MSGQRPKAAKGQTMSQVTVTINGRQFRMACEDGQEGHLMRLAQDLDQRIDKLRGNFGEIGDARLTIMAALTVADELADINSRLKRVEEELGLAAGGARRLRRARQGHPGGDLGRAQRRGRAHRGPDPAAQPDRGRKRRGDGREDLGLESSPRARRRARRRSQVVDGPAIRTTLAGRGCSVRQEQYSRGLIDL